ncbi:MAG: helix-turn-helix transcriptional regulator [Treponema sp.]|nr:helix-turn-helix transcriptional regulator [Treponema sp.]
MKSQKIQFATLQDGWVSESDPAMSCFFDYEVITEPTKALIHQAARFLYVKYGSGTIVIDSVKYELKPNTLLSIMPWCISDVTEVHEPLQLIKVVYDYQYINTILKGTFSHREDSAELLYALSQKSVVYLDAVQAEHIDAVMNGFKSEIGIASTRVVPVDQPFSMLYTASKLIELMVVFVRYVLSHSDGKAEERLQEKNTILTYIYTHSSERLTLESVSKALFISESTLAKRITAITGQTFIKIVNNIRVEKASNYLIHTHITVDEIAILVGFVDASHLHKQFVAQIGVTPTQYRKIYSKTNTCYGHTEKNIAFVVTDYLHKNYSTEKMSAAKVAQEFGVPVAEMNRSLLFYAEKNFDTLLNFIRINKACELLVSTNYAIIDVAVEVGYANIKTFNLNFYKFRKQTPSSFRKNITLQSVDGSEAAFKHKKRAVTKQ